ncbi:MAG: NMD3-related protein [Candidatus Woesearchaeota archaeon]
MALRKCAVCGKGIKEGSFCSEHSPQGITYAPFEVKACQCGRMLLGGIWKPVKDMPATLRRIVKDRVTEHPVTIHVPNVSKPMPNKTKDIDVTIRHGGNEYIVPLRIIGKQCDLCSQDTKYFEGMIQARNLNEERENALLKYVNDAAPRLKITKEVKMETGKDYFITSNSIASGICDKMYRRFGGVLKKNEQLFSKDRQTQKELFRMSFYLELPDFDKGDVVLQEDKLVYIRSLGKQIKGVNLITGKNALVYPEKEHEKMEVYKLEVVQTHPRVTVLHPKTFQAEQVQNTVDAEVGEKIDVVLHKGVYAVVSHK